MVERARCPNSGCRAPLRRGNGSSSPAFVTGTAWQVIVGSTTIRVWLGAKDAARTSNCISDVASWCLPQVVQCRYRRVVAWSSRTSRWMPLGLLFGKATPDVWGSLTSGST